MSVRNRKREFNYFCFDHSLMFFCCFKQLAWEQNFKIHPNCMRIRCLFGLIYNVRYLRHIQETFLKLRACLLVKRAYMCVYVQLYLIHAMLIRTIKKCISECLPSLTFWCSCNFISIKIGFSINLLDLLCLRNMLHSEHFISLKSLPTMCYRWWRWYINTHTSVD